jgi:hypothetical protein
MVLLLLVRKITRGILVAALSLSLPCRTTRRIIGHVVQAVSKVDLGTLDDHFGFWSLGYCG